MMNDKVPAGAVARFERNLLGRDFAMGDIHGEFDLAARALDLVGFDGAKDRLFCVGDLVDRGSRSHEVLDFLERPGIHSVKGNHEDDLARLARGPAGSNRRMLETICRQMGLSWWLDLEGPHRERIVQAFEGLPVCFEVETSGGLVGILHAEPAPALDWEFFCGLLESAEPFAIESALRGREVAEGREEGGTEGIWRVFAGHSPAFGGLARFGNLHLIDTGAVFGRLRPGGRGHLTLVRIDADDSELMAAAPKMEGGSIEIRGA